MIKITSKKFFSEWGNGTSFGSNLTDFATHLKANIGEKLRVVTELEIIRVTESTQSNPIYVESDASGRGVILRRVSGSWIQEGWIVGNTILNVKDYSATSSLHWSDTIVSVTDLIITLTTPRTGADLGAQSDNGFINPLVSPHLTYKFGLAENGDMNPSTSSPYSNEQQYYYFDTIDTVTPTDHTMNVGASNKNWYSGDTIVRWMSSSDPLTLGQSYSHKYRVTHDFIVSPEFVEDYLTNYENNTKPEIFEGLNSPKYVQELEFRTIATNSNTGAVFSDILDKGNCGWYNENYNGGASIYTISDIEYTDTATTDIVDSLQSKSKTTIKGSINGSGFANTDKVGLYFKHLAPLAQYSVNQGSYQNTFLYKSKIVTMVAGTVTYTGSGIIKRLKVDFVSASKLTFEADIELTTIQKDYVGENNYVLALQLGNNNAVDTSNKVMQLVDFNTWVINNDVDGLCTFEKQGFKLHNQSESEAGYTDYKGWPQDGTVFTSTIVLNKTLEANLKGLIGKLIAYNTNTDEYFELQRYVFDLGNVSTINANPSYQLIDLAATRKFRLATGDYFNNVKLTFLPIVGTEQRINVQLAFKFDWQSWIKNNNADTIFVDTSKPQNGLGNIASNYSLVNGYEIRFRLEADITQFDQTTSSVLSTSTTYIDESPSLNIYPYDTDATIPANWSCLIETFNSSNVSLSGALLANADTKLKMTWTPQSGSTSDFLSSWAIHRIEQYLSVGYGNIDELSSIRDSRVNNLLKPLSGETYLKITDSGTTIVTECLIDYTKLITNQYNLSGRIGNVKIYGRYKTTADFKFLDADKTEAILFNSNAPYTASVNELRYAQLDTNHNVFLEENIVLDGAYDYLFCKIAVDENEQSNGKNVFYLCSFDGTATHVHRFAYNGTTFIQSLVFNGSLGGSNPSCLRIDPALSPNGRAFLWFGNRQATIGAGYGFKTAYWNGGAWTITNVNMYNFGDDHTFLNPQDIIFDGADIYIMNHDQGTSTSPSQQEQGKIGLWQQTSGSTTDPTDRSTFSNYAFQYDVYRNATVHENVDGTGNLADLAYSLGFEILGHDSNLNPIFIVGCQPTQGGRHYARLRANTASPINSTGWTIETPMSHLNGLYGTPTTLSGTASSTAHSTLLPEKSGCFIAVIDENTFISGNTFAYFFTKHTINSWTGASNNDWYINAPFDPNYNFTSGDILTQ